MSSKTKISSSNALSAIDTEIEVLDEIIKLKMKKLDLLKSARKVAFGTSYTDFVEVSAVDPKAYTLLEDISLTPSTEHRGSAAILPTKTTNGGDLFFQTTEIKNNYTMNALGIMSVKASKVNSFEYITLVSSIDQIGYLHIHSTTTGHELEVIDLEHTAPVIATHYEGTDSRAYFVSTARDGSVHVTCMEIKKSNIFVKGLNQVPGDVTSDGTVVTASICVKFTLTQPDDGNSLAYGTSVFMSTKGNPGLKGRTLFIGDNNGVLHQHNSDKGLFVSNLTINSLGLPISSIAKSRVQLMVASGTTISMVSPIPKMKIGNYECYGPKENIIQILTDVKNPAMLYAKLENGAVVVFHTRYKEAVETTSFNPLLVFSRRNKKDVNVCRIFRTIASIKDNIKENLQAGSLSVTKNYIITAEKDYLTVFPTVIASQPNQGIHSLADITFESELANRMKLKFQDFLAKMKKTEIVVSNFDKGFSGIRIDSNTGVNPKPKQVGIFSMLAPAKVIPEKEPFFLVGFNSLFPSSEISEARSSIFIYQFKTQEREHKKSNGTGWMDLLSKGPIALVMIGALYLFKTKFSKKRDRDAGNKRGGKGGNYKGFGSRSFQKGVETRFGKGLESNFESKIVSSSVAAKEEHHEVPDNTPRDTSDYQEIDSSSFSIQELSDKLESLNAIQLEGQIVDEKDIHFEG